MEFESDCLQDRVVDGGFDANTALSHTEQEDLFDVVSIIRRSSVDSKQLHATERY